MPVTISGTAGITYPAGGLANTVGAGVGTSDTQTLTSKTLTSPTLTTPNIDSAQIPTVSGTAPLYMARAWVNFNGTGTVAIRGSGNVSSITDVGVGEYTVNFTTAMSDANYSVSMSVMGSTGTSRVTVSIPTGNTPTTSSFRMSTQDTSTTNQYDPVYVFASIFR
jgi:hypothetical protein